MHLETLNCIYHLAAQLLIVSKSSCNSEPSSWFITTRYNLVSSANFNTLLGRSLSKSFIKMRISTGPSSDPCGTPLHTRLQLEHEPSWQTHCFLSANQARIQLHTKPSISWTFSFNSRRWWGTLSNALARSKLTVSTFSLSSMQAVTNSKNVLLKPCCEFLIRLCWSRCCASWSLMTDSTTLHIWLVKLTGR